MKAKLIIKKQKLEGFERTLITHIKILDDNGKYCKFAKHGQDLIDYIQEIEIDIDQLIE